MCRANMHEHSQCYSTSVLVVLMVGGVGIPAYPGVRMWFHDHSAWVYSILAWWHFTYVHACPDATEAMV